MSEMEHLKLVVSPQEGLALIWLHSKNHPSNTDDTISKHNNANGDHNK